MFQPWKHEERTLSDSYRKSLLYAEATAFLLVAVWGVNTPVMKIGLMTTSPLIFNFLRLVIAAATSFLFMVMTKSHRKMPAGDLMKLALVSFFGFFLNQIFFIYGLPLTTAGNASLMLATLPVSVVVINQVMKIENISRKAAMGITISLIGIIFIVIGAEKELSLAGSHVLGAFFLLAAQFCYAYYTVFFRQFIGRYSVFQISTYVMTLCAFLFCLASLPEMVRTEWQSLSATVWYCLIYSSLLAVTAGNIVWFWVVGMLGSTRAATFHNLSPIFAIAFAWVALDETLGVLQVFGAVLIFIGLYFTRKHNTVPPIEIVR